jgi:hypothetical protein
MLGRGHGQQLLADLWELTEVKVQIPSPLADGFLTTQGPAATYFDDKRAYQRFFLRGKAVLKRSGSLMGAYTKDVSRQGVGFLSPVQLMPRERVKLSLPSAELQLEVSRCRRVDKDCFDCGARFALSGPIANSAD